MFHLEMSSREYHLPVLLHDCLNGLLIDPSYKLLYVFAVYLLVVILRPQGIFGRY